ncbi:MAG: tyrosine--tRNA ligase [Patescibacteria group bacterium]
MAKINTDQVKIQEILTRGVENIYPNKEYLKKLLSSGKQLSLYLGIDPTGPSLHLGHAINLEKLRQFQALGHKIILLIGDFTGTVGDPTDKSAVRKALTRAEVLNNARDYKKQASRVLNFSGNNKAEIKFNSTWQNKMNFAQVLDVAKNFTVQRLLERDMFQERLKSARPIYLHEFMYPVLQAYDCVAMGVDGELGGNDQTFNMLAGRELMKTLKNKEKFVITMKLLTDSSGKKMGKTENNMAALSDTPQDMFGKIMSWTDNMIVPGFELCTRVAISEIKQIEKDLKSGKNPRDLKFTLAMEIVEIYFGENAAQKAGQEFTNIFAKKENPLDIPEFAIKTGKINPADLLMLMSLVGSKSEARRLVDGGGMKINHAKIAAWDKDIEIKSGDVVQAGKRKFGKVK